jgi:ketosteroid isomerase-like protein
MRRALSLPFRSTFLEDSVRLTRLALAASACALAACQKPETAEQMASRIRAESDSAQTAITAMSTSFAAHMLAGHVDSVVTMYGDDAALMAPNMPAAHGKAAIKAAFTGMMTGGTMSAFTLTTTAVTANGPMAIETGRYRLSMTPPGGAMMSDSGKYMVHWHKVSGRWIIASDIWNTDAPMPAAPAPPARRRG